MELERKKVFLIKLLYATAWGVLVFLILALAKNLLLPFLAGFCIAYFLRPAARFISKHSRAGMRTAAYMACLFFYILLAAGLWGVGLLLYVKIDDAFYAIPELYQNQLLPILQKGNSLFVRAVELLAPKRGEAAASFLQPLEGIGDTVVAEASQWLTEKAGAFFGNIPEKLLFLLFMVLSSVFFCSDYPMVTEFILRQIPQRLHTPLRELKGFFLYSLGKLLKSYLLLGLITFAQLLTGLLLLKMPYAFLAAFLLSLLDLLPVIGSGVILVPWAMLCLLGGGTGTGIGLLLLWGGVTVVRQLLEPRIMGNQLGLPPLVTLVSMYLGMRLLGMSGLFLAPVACLLVVYLQEKNFIKLYR